MASKWIPTLPGLIFEERESHIDSRGSFIRFLELDGNSFTDAFSSIALSRNPIAGTIRGLHFQNYPYSEEKAIMCIKGSIFEVFVDLRRQCQTYGHWTHRVLSSTNFSKSVDLISRYAPFNKVGTLEIVGHDQHRKKVFQEQLLNQIISQILIPARAFCICYSYSIWTVSKRLSK